MNNEIEYTGVTHPVFGKEVKWKKSKPLVNYPPVGGCFIMPIEPEKLSTPIFSMKISEKLKNALENTEFSISNPCTVPATRPASF